MEQISVIDAHTHVFPDKIARKASESIGQFYGIGMRFDGRVDTLVKLSDHCPIRRSIVFSTATHPEQVRAINRFIATTVSSHPQFAGLGTLHPGLSAAEIRTETDFMISAGLRGIKLHPDFQELYPDAPDMDPIYEAALERNLCFVFHAGDERKPYSHPARIADVARRYPGLSLVAAHMGGYTQWDIAFDLLAPYRNVSVDTSSTMSFVEPDQMVRLIRSFGADRVLFGSDYPMWNPCDELASLLALPLEAVEQQAILYGNAARLFRLDT